MTETREFSTNRYQTENKGDGNPWDNMSMEGFLNQAKQDIGQNFKDELEEEEKLKKFNELQKKLFSKEIQAGSVKEHEILQEIYNLSKPKTKTESDLDSMVDNLEEELKDLHFNDVMVHMDELTQVLEIIKKGSAKEKDKQTWQKANELQDRVKRLSQVYPKGKKQYINHLKEIIIAIKELLA